MAEENETIILSVELDVSQLTAAAAAAKREIDDLKKKQDELKEAGEQNSEAFEENATALRAARKEYADTNKAIDNTLKARKEEKGSLEQLKAQLSLATKEYGLLSKEQRENSKGGQDLKNRIKSLSDELKRNESAIGDNRRNVGNYGSAILDAAKGNAQFGGALNTMGNIIKLSPIGILLTAIGALVAIFSKLQPVIDKVNEILGGIGEVFEVLAARAGRIIDAFGKLFSGDFSGAASDLDAAFSGLADSIGDAYEAGVNYAKIQKEISDTALILSVQNAEAEKQIAGLTQQLKNRTLSEKERLGIAAEITRIESERFKNEEANLSKSVKADEDKLKRILKENGALLTGKETIIDLIKLGQDRAIEDKLLDELAAKQVTLTNAQKESLTITERAAARTDALREEQKRSAEEAEKAAQKKRDSQIKFALDEEETLRELDATAAELDRQAKEEQLKNQEFFDNEKAAKLRAQLELYEAIKTRETAIHKAEVDKQIKEATRLAQTSEAFIAGVGDVFAQALTDQGLDAKKFSKGIVTLMLDTVEKIAVAQIASSTAQSLAQPDSIATFGTSGIIRAGILTGLIKAAVSIAKAQVGKLALGGTIMPKAEQGMIIGGEPHSRGGTKFFGSDGTMFEAEKDELLAVVNKRSTGMLRGLSAWNEMGGGVSYFKKGGLQYLADGGIAGRGFSSPIDAQLEASNRTRDAILNLPSPVVIVQDINEAQFTDVKVRSRAEIG